MCPYQSSFAPRVDLERARWTELPRGNGTSAFDLDGRVDRRRRASAASSPRSATAVRRAHPRAADLPGLRQRRAGSVCRRSPAAAGPRASGTALLEAARDLQRTDRRRPAWHFVGDPSRTAMSCWQPTVQTWVWNGSGSACIPRHHHRSTAARPPRTTPRLVRWCFSAATAQRRAQPASTTRPGRGTAPTGLSAGAPPAERDVPDSVAGERSSRVAVQADSRRRSHRSVRPSHSRRRTATASAGSAPAPREAPAAASPAAGSRLPEQPQWLQMGDLDDVRIERLEDHDDAQVRAMLVDLALAEQRHFDHPEETPDQLSARLTTSPRFTGENHILVARARRRRCDRALLGRALRSRDGARGRGRRAVRPARGPGPGCRAPAHGGGDGRSSASREVTFACVWTRGDNQAALAAYLSGRIRTDRADRADLAPARLASGRDNSRSMTLSRGRRRSRRDACQARPER